MLKKIKNLSKEIGTLSLGLALALIIFMGLSVANGWSEPTKTAPEDNLGAPINTSVNVQDKSGQMGSVGGGAYGTGALKIGIHTLNSNNNGWLYLGDQFNGIYGSRGLAVDNSWTKSNAYFADGTSIWNSAGNVGIGTTSPATKLDVDGDIQFNSILRTPGRMHITGEERLYLLNKNGVYITSNWGGNGYLEVGNLTSTNTLRVRNGAGAGKVLTSDASGNASWAAPASGKVAGDPIWTQCRMVKAHSHGDGSPFIAYATASCDPTEVMVSHAIGYGAAQGCVDNSTVDSASFGCADQYFSYDWHTVHFYASAKCCKKR